MEHKAEMDIRYLKGVGEKRAQLYHRLGIDSPSDLLYHLPRSYIDLSHPQEIASWSHQRGGGRAGKDHCKIRRTGASARAFLSLR
jgi:RecG-like helicase